MSLIDEIRSGLASHIDPPPPLTEAQLALEELNRRVWAVLEVFFYTDENTEPNGPMASMMNDVADAVDFPPVRS